MVQDESHDREEKDDDEEEDDRGWVCRALLGPRILISTLGTRDRCNISLLMIQNGAPCSLSNEFIPFIVGT